MVSGKYASTSEHCLGVCWEVKSEKWTLVYLELAHGHRQANSNFSWVLLHHDSLRSANLSPNHLLPPTTHIDMADEVYDGAIGIDLGTTYSCVANYEGAGVEIMYVWALKFGEKSGHGRGHLF